MITRRIKIYARAIKLPRWLKYIILILVFAATVIRFELYNRKNWILVIEKSVQKRSQSGAENPLNVSETGRYIPFVNGRNELVESSNDTKIDIRKSTVKRNKTKNGYLVNVEQKKDASRGYSKKDYQAKFKKKKTFVKLFINSTSNTTVCEFKQHPYFPHCEAKVSYLEKAWKIYPCFYKVHKVNGTDCSIHNYLTNIEPYCMGEKKMYVRTDTIVASMNYDLNGLLALFNYDYYQWMRNRISFLWPTWLSAGKSYSILRKKRKIIRKRVLVFPWALEMGHYMFFGQAGKGGPLGELIQWSDLTAALYLLGYDVIFVTKIPDLLKAMKFNETVCASGTNEAKIDVIYTDILGVIMLERKFGSNSFIKYKCMLRVLDSFGTFPEFNYPRYPRTIPGGGRSSWGNLNLIPTQFLTLYPHTHDNNFLGFVIPEQVKSNHSNINNKNTKSPRKRQQALLYAKRASYIKGYEDYLRIISRYLDVHATCVIDHPLPAYIKNHGPVSTGRIQELLSQSKVFIGVGFPFEGPGPMEAMANGAVYLQPKFDVPVNKLNSKFFAGKPTLRNLTSQNPYMEEFVGEPYCFTINIRNEDLLRSTLHRIKTMKRLPPKIPREFSNEGLIERAHAFTEYMDYCNPYSPPWPPLKNLQTFISQLGQSCKDLCMSKGLVCERTYFNEINKALLIQKYSRLRCNKVKIITSLHPPSVDAHTRTCFIQQQQQTFSCMYGEQNITRLCPCRNYEKEQSAICRNCF